MYDRLSIKLGLVPAKEKKPYRIPARSDKRKQEQKEYVKIVKEMLATDPNCEIREEGCQVKASGLHHMKKRSPATFLDRKFLKRACDNCQTWVEIHPLEAIEKGHSVSKHLPSVLIASQGDGAVIVEGA